MFEMKPSKVQELAPITHSSRTLLQAQVFRKMPEDSAGTNMPYAYVYLSICPTTNSSLHRMWPLNNTANL